MGVRETLNNRSGLTTGIAGGVAVFGIVLIVWQVFARADGVVPVAQGSYYFTVDDGQTYFPQATEVYPFDHNSKPAYRAVVLRCAEGEPHVAFLMRYTNAAKASLEKLLADRPADFDSQLRDLIDRGTEVKRRGEKKWVPLMSPQGVAIVGAAGKCPDGTERPVAVAP